MIPISLDLLLREPNQPFEMAEVSLLEQFVAEHRAEGRRERHREMECDAFVHQPAHHAQQREVGFGEGFEEPVFLEEILVLGMPDERAGERGG